MAAKYHDTVPEALPLLPTGGDDYKIAGTAEDVMNHTDQNRHPIQAALLGRNEGILPKDESDLMGEFGEASIP